MNKCKSCIWANKVNPAVIHCPFANCIKTQGWIADKNLTVNEPLPDRLFVKTKEEEVLLVTKEDDAWWVEEDYTHGDYDSNYDTSGTMSHDRLLTNLRNGEYTRVPDSEGWLADEKNNQTTNQSDNQTI